MAREVNDRDINQALAMIESEYRDARRKFPPFRSQHEGYAVLLEEVDELWTAIKANTQPLARDEAVQVAAMAIAFMLET